MGVRLKGYLRLKLSIRLRLTVRESVSASVCMIVRSVSVMVAMIRVGQDSG